MTIHLAFSASFRNNSSGFSVPFGIDIRPPTVATRVATVGGRWIKAANHSFTGCKTVVWDQNEDALIWETGKDPKSERQE